ncbi:MAG: HlyD family efflux transporter periplasmic adaptor subunit [Chloroflexota bacterium]|nr:MAG: HlyD family efflux transporter periplasmic adaptor subunit [Chloroflexota bacterium]
MNGRTLAVAGALALAISTGCIPFGAPTEEPTPTPVPVEQSAGKQTYDVQRGSIFDTIKGIGRISAKTETPLYFKQTGRVRSVTVNILDQVRKGDLLAELDTNDLRSRIERARIEIELAQIEHARQVANASTVRFDVKSAAASLVAAQAAVSRAESDLARLEAGPRPEDLAAAEAANNGALAAYQRAYSQLMAVRDPSAREEGIAAEQALARARAAVEKAQADYDAIAWRPGASASGQALALQLATADYEAALAAVRLRTTPRAEDVQSAEKSLESALRAQHAAEARLNQVRAGARGEDVVVTRIALDSARVALADTQAAYTASEANARIDVTNFDVAMAAKKLELARVKYRGLEEELEAARVRAPYDGVITFVTGRQGQQFQAFAPIAIISDPATLEVAVEFDGQVLGRVLNGQIAVVTTEAYGSSELKGKVVRLPSTIAVATGPQSTSNPRAVRISFEAPSPGAQLGQLAQVTVITQQKDNIILIPNTAVRRFGSRRYVQLLVDGRRRDVDVETGLVTETDTEITKGLREGQTVIVP